MCAIDSLIETFRTPIAKRKGVTISSEDCALWAEEIEKEMTYIRGELKKYYNLKYEVRKLR